MIERRLISSDDELGIWHYSIISEEDRFTQDVRRALDGTGFVTFVAHRHPQVAGGYELEVFDVILSHTLFSSFDEAISAGDTSVENWRPRKPASP
jgi:hypothetical protein